MGKLWNRIDNTISIPERIIHTVGLAGIDLINTLDGIPQDITSVVINTRKKIVDLFSKDLERYKKARNIPIATWVWVTWVLEALLLKPVVNIWWNITKTATNLVSNTLKSTIWSLFSTNPVSDISFNSLKRKWKTYHIDTTKPVRSRDRILAKYRWYLSKELKDELIKEKERKLDKMRNKS